MVVFVQMEDDPGLVIDLDVTVVYEVHILGYPALPHNLLRRRIFKQPLTLLLPQQREKVLRCRDSNVLARNLGKV
jgi:hypothetical protein